MSRMLTISGMVACGTIFAGALGACSQTTPVQSANNPDKRNILRIWVNTNPSRPQPKGKGVLEEDRLTLFDVRRSPGDKGLFATGSPTYQNRTLGPTATSDWPQRQEQVVTLADTPAPAAPIVDPGTPAGGAIVAAAPPALGTRADANALDPAPQPSIDPVLFAVDPDEAPVLDPAGPAAAPAPNAKARTYTVVNGDTLWGIAKRFYGAGIKWKEIAAANPDIDPDHLKLGQTLTLP